MGREARGRREPHLPKVERIELSDSHVKGRLAATVLLLLAGVALIVFSVMKLFSADAGWQEIEVEAAGEVHCGGDFSLLYELGKEGISVNTEKRGVTSVYSDAAKIAYEIFNADVEIDGVANLWYINRHPNEEISVDEALYNAFLKMREDGGRFIYLGPAYSVYDNLFYMTSSEVAYDFDPHLNPYIGNLFREICKFADDPAAVELELLENNIVKLNVSPEYLAFAAEEELEDFIDFYWLKNAFIADYMAERLLAEGYTRGLLSSYDGFVRCLDGSGTEFTCQLYHLQGDSTVVSEDFNYSGPQSFVTLKSYPLSSQDLSHYLILPDGSVRTPYLSPVDGLDRCCVEELTAYSRTAGCAKIALMIAPIYIDDKFSESALSSLAEAGINAVYWEDDRVVSNSSL